MNATLHSLLACDAETISEAAGASFEAITEKGKRPLILFGAGQMGRAVFSALRDKPVKVLGFADNNPTRWGKSLEGLPLLSPSSAARAHGQEAVFITAFQADPAYLLQEEARLADFGVEHICPFPVLLRRWPETCGWPIGTPALYREREEDLAATLDLLGDDISRQQFLAHLRWRLTRDDRALPEGSPQDQYFLASGSRLRKDECLVDGGAFDGDTLRAFLRLSCEAFGHVHAFEPDPISHAALRAFLDKLPPGVARRITTYEAALGDCPGLAHLQAQGNHLSTLGTEGTPVQILSVDSLPEEIPVSFIKLDLEGSERQALDGSVRTLARHRPILATAIYHHPVDLFEIPLLIRELCPNYRFHLRTHNRFGLDVVLYAIPAERSR